MEPKIKYQNSPFFTCLVFSQAFFILSEVVALFMLGVNGYPVLLMGVCLGIAIPIIIKINFGKWMPNAGLVLFIASISWFLGICFLIWGWLPSLEQFGPLHGIDPARYYYRSIELLDSGFDISQVSGGLADPGILYFYAIVMVFLVKIYLRLTLLTLLYFLCFLFFSLKP